MRRLRKITIGLNVKESINYTVGSPIPKTENHKVSEIIKKENEGEEMGYFVYATNGKETQLWKRIPLNEELIVEEFFIDFEE